MLNLLKIGSSLLFVVFSTIAYAEPGAGSCADFKLPTLATDKTVIDRTEPVRILRQGVPLYPDATSTTSVKSLDFDTVLLLTKKSDLRFEVKEMGAKIALGWIDKHELLCSFRPLFEKGLARKAFIKIPIGAESNFNIKTSHSPDRDECSPRRPCDELSRFTTYFIFAEDRETHRYLLSQGYNLTTGTKLPLVGWIKGENMIPWNTNLGIRPKNDSKEEADTEIITGYHTLKDAKLNAEGIKLLSGNIWYSYELHVPLLDRVENYYHVAAPGIGMEGFKRSDTTQTFNEMRQVDVFFLLDGTASMDPYVTAAKEASKGIAEELQRQREFQQTTFRFGFLVYRDTFADNLLGKKICNDGICERQPLDRTTCQSDTSITDNSFAKFEKAIKKVTATAEKNDDYPEQLFAGLEAVIPEMSACPNNNKLVFVIGDHGDAGETISQSVIDRFKRTFPKLAIFFIQTPSNVLNIRNSESYREAYNKFQTQANAVIDGILPKEYNGVPIPRNKYFWSLTADNLPQSVVDIVKSYSNAAVSTELEQTLANGEAVKEAIKKYMADGDMPVLYWQWVEKTACEKLGEQCNKPLNHRVMDFYIPEDPKKIQEEMMMIEQHIDRWIKLLAKISQTRGGSATKKRENFVELLIEEIQNVLGDPPISLTVDDKTALQTILEQHKSVLPMREQSPLLQYSLADIWTMEGCELDRLLEWVTAIRNVLEKVVGSPELKVSFELKDYTDECPGMTDKGKRIKKMVSYPEGRDKGEKSGPSQVESLGKDSNYRYGHVFRNVTLYWLPVEFLP
ncbi:MAG: hypothetical protein BWK78_00670 [Thiotrichaceae bacterium IS1]|nr:MAG: hypothetical protein BWK78_00670 [Thiotrichaceae bacterium IS1]